MAVGTRTSGLIQRIIPFVHHDRIEMNGAGAQLSPGANIVDALRDPNGPVAGTIYDGLTVNGVLKVDLGAVQP